jgi:hypothetical protein
MKLAVTQWIQASFASLECDADIDPGLWARIPTLAGNIDAIRVTEGGEQGETTSHIRGWSRFTNPGLRHHRIYSQ